MAGRMVDAKMRLLILVPLLLLYTVAIATAEPLPLVTGNNYPPFTDESLPQRGMMTEIVKLAFEKSGYETAIVFRPWKRGYEETKQGKFAGTFPYIKTEERVNDFYYSDSIHITYTRIFVTQNAPIQTSQDLQGKRICIPLGYAVNKELAKLLADKAIRRQANPVNLQGCLKMMLSGRKDFFVINEINGWMTIQNAYQSKAKFRTLDKIFHQESHYFIVPKSYPNGKDILSHFNRGLKKLRDEGILDDIVSRHLQGILN